MRKLIENQMLLSKIKAFINPTEDMSQRELSMALNKIDQKLKIDNTYDVPYLAGYSRDGKTIYIDKRIPKYLTYKNKSYNIYRFLILHEMIEKALIDQLGGLHYQLAHEIATRAEYAAIIGEKFSYHKYNRFIQEKLAEIRNEPNYYVPPDLDLKPYLDSKDKTLIKRIKTSLKINWESKKNSKIKINKNPTVVKHLIKPKKNFPNNTSLPVIVYQQALMLNYSSINEVKKLLANNGWHNIWVDSIYDYDHYHSNTHEALVIFSGCCLVQLGGPKGRKLTVAAGDVIFFPAGVAHKKIEASNDFKTIGSYPFRIDYDIQTHKKPLIEEKIQQIKLPKSDPIFGKNKRLLNYWKSKN